MTLTIAPLPMPLSTDAEGVVRVGRTRIPLDTVIFAFQEGATAEEIAQRYPSLDLADIYAVIGYYLRQRSEVDAYLYQRQQQANTIRALNESRHDPTGIRDRLLARKKV